MIKATMSEQNNFKHSTTSEIRVLRNIVPDESLAIGQLLSRELLKISMTDRAAIQEEIHGVRCLAIPETPELLKRGLEEFRNELDKIPKEQKRTYEECCVRAMLYQDEEDTCYALNDEFKLRFLRFELFDAAKAAQRFVNYMEFVREFWGADIALKRLIRFSDFNKAEMKLFRKGYFQVLPFRDSCGRRVLTLLGGLHPGVDPVMRAKAIFYLTDVLTRTDIESQQKGMIATTEAYCWSAEDSSGGRDKRSKTLLQFPHPKEGLYYTKRLLESVANRLIAIHNCWPDRPAFRIISKLLTIYGVSGSKQRMRLQFHVGDELEMRYRLKSFGIPIELLPITETGSIKMTNHNHWIKTRKHIEQGIDKNIRIIECPGSNDVVFRQGTSSMENPGNVRCRDLILSFLEEREKTTMSRIQTSNDHTLAARIHNEIVDRLLDTIERKHHARFLEWDKHRGTWTQMFDRAKVKQKVSVLLHSVGKRYRKRVVPSHTSSSSKSRIRKFDDEIRSDPVLSNVHVSRAVASPTISLEQNLNEMVIKSGEDDEAEQELLGPYSFLEGGRNAYKQQQCCRLSDDYSMQQISRKRMKKV
eukprot:CAMPEP_0116134128 /NCGR_PEP_ID=MMETSP0329-20121206/10482_1 /TAXON_ID=697910 /ORGANISM="Pseudo-nitzschia arenysensis, Strain B593" /LENGTH=585 /DNA_ID=CAMNT_0003628821 /DNA_START=100 /DNA_END=1857 /DNA_ORIENTATION=-